MTNKIPYDNAYKLLFSEPAMVRDLLLGFLGEEWVHELDFSTLQRLGSEYVADTLRDRESDVVWKVQWKGETLYLLLLIEFQSTVDAFMVVRMLSYISLLYQDIIKQDEQIKRSRQLPPVLPLIVYMGTKPWNTPLKMSDLIAPNVPKMLKNYQPDLQCWLLDEQHCIIKDVEPSNLVLPLIVLEQSQELSVASATVAQLVKLLSAPHWDSLRRAYLVYLKRILKAKTMLPDVELDNLNEVQKMLDNRVDIWMKNAEEKGMEKGMEKGISRGISEGELAVIKRQLTKRFGSLTAEHLHILHSKSDEELLDISERLLDAHCIEDIM